MIRFMLRDLPPPGKLASARSCYETFNSKENWVQGQQIQLGSSELKELLFPVVMTIIM